MNERAHLVLASGSPRRRALLDLLGLRHVVRVSDVDEIPRPDESADAFTCRAARDKAMAVAESSGGLPVLGADTVVEVEGRILGKPESAAVAENMLFSLSGRDHRVHTSMALVHAGRCADLIDTTTVRFRTLDAKIVQWYLESGECLDKAGAYAIQGIGGLLVESISGSPHTVVGLPIHRLPELFTAADLEFWRYLGSSEDG